MARVGIEPTTRGFSQSAALPTELPGQPMGRVLDRRVWAPSSNDLGNLLIRLQGFVVPAAGRGIKETIRGPSIAGRLREEGLQGDSACKSLPNRPAIESFFAPKPRQPTLSSSRHNFAHFSVGCYTLSARVSESHSCITTTLFILSLKRETPLLCPQTRTPRLAGSISEKPSNPNNAHLPGHTE